MAQAKTDTADTDIRAQNPNASSSVVLVCEHATVFIPPSFNDLSLSDKDKDSHVAWDPGALAVASELSKELDATLIAGVVSRLVFDCNRPPDALDAMPAKSEVVDVPGNANLSAEQKAKRIAAFYDPFCAAVAQAVSHKPAPLLVTVHSFTPIYFGKPRDVGIGILHDKDSRLADAMLDIAHSHTKANVQRNQPYGPEDGVTHTLKKHALPGGHLNVMIEIRSDLIQTESQQTDMAKMIAGWIVEAFQTTNQAGSVRCLA